MSLEYEYVCMYLGRYVHGIVQSYTSKNPGNSPYVMKNRLNIFKNNPICTKHNLEKMRRASTKYDWTMLWNSIRLTLGSFGKSMGQFYHKKLCKLHMDQSKEISLDLDVI